MRTKKACKWNYGPITRARQIYKQYWMAWEIRGHAKKSAFPDWGCLADRYMENKRRDYKADYGKRRKKEIEYKKEYRQRPEVKSRTAERRREERKDPSIRVRHNLSKRLCEIMKGRGLKKSSILNHVGCSVQDLKSHIESQFKRGMRWDNYGAHWHVDHIIPCAEFDHTDKNQVAICWHWTNLRPLKAQDNISKGDSVTMPQMSLRF